MIRRLVFLGATLTMLLNLSIVVAQHEGDIEVHIHDGEIEIENGAPSVWFASKMFEGEFSTGGLFNRTTINPGFEAHDGLPDFAGNVIGFDLLPGHNGNFLHFFDPVAGALAASHSHSMHISWGSIPGQSLTLSALTGGSGLISEIESDGELHAHLNFWIHPDLAPAANGTFGAYGLLMSLNIDDPSIANSDPFWLIFNYGMTEEAFEASLASFTGIPEPSTAAVLGLLALSAVFRRRRA